MFEITPETKAAAVEAIKEVFKHHKHEHVPSDEVLHEAIDAAVTVVKAQFGF